MCEIRLKPDELADLSSKVLGQGGHFCFKANGQSMYPFIRNGDVLVIKPVHISELKRGDVILFRPARNRCIVHRIVGKKDREDRLRLLVRGDSSLRSDGWISSSQVLGRVESLKRSEKIIGLNYGIMSCLARFWVKVHPVGPILIKLAAEVERIRRSVLRGLQHKKNAA
jgi:signal peptidase